MAQGHYVLDQVAQVTTLEKEKRDELRSKKPRVYEKIQRFDANALRGIISPIFRLCWDYLCNFNCKHCCAEPDMERDKQRLVQLGTHSTDTRRRMNHEDLARFAHELDEYGGYRVVLTGGEPSTWSDLLTQKGKKGVIEILNPDRHLIIMDTNAWRVAEDPRYSVQALADAGVYKLQVSLDSFIEEEHDIFRSKPGSHRRVMKILPQVIPAGMKLLVSTCLTAGRASTQEFLDLNNYCTYELGAMLYVTLAKPSGTCVQHLDWICHKPDVDKIHEFEAKGYNITMHMTPSHMRQVNTGSAPLGHYDGCITVKGINNLEPNGEIIPCPYMHTGIGNIFDDSLTTILDRGMRIWDLGPQRNECLIGQNFNFMERHNAAVEKWQAAGKYLPVPWGEFWTEKDLIQIHSAN